MQISKGESGGRGRLPAHLDGQLAASTAVGGTGYLLPVFLYYCNSPLL